MTAASDPLRIVIAEDAAIMRDGLTQTLTRRGHDVVAAVADAEALRLAVDEHLPDVAVIDVRMPPTHTDEGLRAAQAIHKDHPGVGVLVFSQYIETQSAAELLASAPAGVGYLLKDRVADVSDFVDAITRVAHGGTVLDPEVVRQLLTASRRRDTLAALTPREREVLSLIAQGRSNAAIAGTLFISPKVVEKHVANIFDKLGLAPDDNDNRRVIAALRYLESLAHISRRCPSRDTRPPGCRNGWLGLVAHAPRRWGPCQLSQHPGCPPPGHRGDDPAVTGLVPGYFMIMGQVGRVWPKGPMIMVDVRNVPMSDCGITGKTGAIPSQGSRRCR
jgi:DNA-binding NarL/FixJ family response regulator